MKFKEFIYFYPEKPYLVHRDQSLVEDFSADNNYIAEMKYNGSRCIIIVLNGEVSFWNRHGKELRNMDHADPRYKELVKEVKKSVPSTGHYQFEGELRHNKVTGIQYKIILWDCLIYNDEYLNKLIYDERRELVLEHFNVPTDTSKKVVDIDKYRKRITVIKQYKGDFRKLFNDWKAAHERGELPEFEGLVIKNINGKLALGRNSNPDSKWMYKIRIKTGRHKF